MARIPINARPPLAQWLIRSRESQGFESADVFLETMEAEGFHAPGQGTYATWESGAATPRLRTLRPVIDFYRARGVSGPEGIFEDRESTEPDPLAAAINRQAAAIEANTTAVRELIELLAPLALRGVALGSEEAAEVLRRVEGSQSV